MPKFYQTPGGTISTAEKKWKEDMKAEGLSPKEYTGRNTFDVPTKAAELAEFLTFHCVNVVNPQARAAPPAAPAPEVAGGANPPSAPPATNGSTTLSENEQLEALFERAPIALQIQLAGQALDQCYKTIFPNSRI